LVKELTPAPLFEGKRGVMTSMLVFKSIWLKELTPAPLFEGKRGVMTSILVLKSICNQGFDRLN